MIRRLYIHNFRCFENFELSVVDQPSILLVGNNGTGKTTVGLALEVFQKIARGTNRAADLVKPKDLSRGRSDVPMRFELTLELKNKTYKYSIAFDFPEGFKELRIIEENLTVDGEAIYTREMAQVHLTGIGSQNEANFRIDWHVVALPIVQERSEVDPLGIFKLWLARMIILRPIPSLIKGDSEGETLTPEPSLINFGAWFSGLLAEAPASYSSFYEYLKELLPDLKDIQNPLIGKNSRNLMIHFSNDLGSLRLPFEDLSDGEKCFLICALVVAANKAYGPLFCFWDEPDNYLALPEVGHFVLALRKAFQADGQFMATSHHDEAIRRFSSQNTLFLYRRSHLEPAQIRVVDDIQVSGDFVSALARGDVRP